MHHPTNETAASVATQAAANFDSTFGTADSFEITADDTLVQEEITGDAEIPAARLKVFGRRDLPDVPLPLIAKMTGLKLNGSWLNDTGRTYGVLIKDDGNVFVNPRDGYDLEACQKEALVKIDAALAQLTEETVQDAKEQEVADKAAAAKLAEKKRTACAELWDDPNTIPDHPLIERYYKQARGGLIMPQGVDKHSFSYVDGDGETKDWPIMGQQQGRQEQWWSILALIRDFETHEPVGMHATIVKTVTDANSSRIENVKNPDGSSKRFTTGTSTGYIDCNPGAQEDGVLFCAEGKESALALHQMVHMLGFTDPHVWAIGSANNAGKMPRLGKRFHTIVWTEDAEASGKGRKATQELVDVQCADGVTVIRVSMILRDGEVKRDAADVVRECNAQGRMWEKGRDVEVRTYLPREEGDNGDDMPPWDDGAAAGDGDHDAGNGGGGGGGSGSADLDAAIRQLNEDHAFVMEGGRALVFRTEVDPVEKIQSYVRYATHDFKLKYANRLYRVGSRRNAQQISLGEAWLKSPNRTEHLNGVVFDPANRYGAGYKNLWQGFRYAPRPGDCSLLLDHLRRVICSGNEEIYEYVMDWAARAVQFPAKQGEVAIVLRGPEGAGKGLFARALKALFGTHGRQVTNASHLVGRFNAHLQCCVFLFADEAFYAGDKSHRDVLFTLISEPTFTVEAKFRDAAEARNYLHIMMATNADWAVPAGLGDRRFLVLDVLGDMIGDAKYFAAIMDQLENQGGYEALLHQLLNRDISGFNPNKFPKTAALDEQKLMSMDSLHKWWLEVLDRGYLIESEHGLDEELHVWKEDISTDLAFKSYRRYAKENGDRYPKDRTQFGKFMTKLWKPRRYKAGMSLIMGEGWSKSDREYVVRWNKTRAYGYHIGPLDEARAVYARFLKVAGQWGPDVDTDEPAEGIEDTNEVPHDSEIPF